jgi:hypothetical protein
LTQSLFNFTNEGLTLDKAVVDLGTSEKMLGLTFVALSRVRHINDLLLQPFTFERLQKIAKSESLRPRLKEEARLDQLILKTHEIMKNLVI